MDHENELDLLYTVITLPEGEETVAQLCFLDDNTGKITVYITKLITDINIYDIIKELFIL